MLNFVLLIGYVTKIKELDSWGEPKFQINITMKTSDEKVKYIIPTETSAEWQLNTFKQWMKLKQLVVVRCLLNASSHPREGGFYFIVKILKIGKLINSECKSPREYLEKIEPLEESLGVEWLKYSDEIKPKKP